MPRSTICSVVLPTSSCFSPSISAMMRPARGRHDAHHAFHQRRLAVAVGAEQHHGLARIDVERHVLEHAHRAIGGVDLLDGEAIGQGKPSPPRGRGSRPSGSPSAIFLPETSTTSRCEKLITARMMCSIRMMVMPRSLSRISSVDDVLDLRMRQPGHRFVGDQQLRVRRHGARELELAHLHLGEIARQLRRPCRSSATSCSSSCAARIELGRATARTPGRALTV